MKKSIVFLTAFLLLSGFNCTVSHSVGVPSLKGTWTGTGDDMDPDGTLSTLDLTMHVKDQKGSLFYGTLYNGKKTMKLSGNISGMAVTITVLAGSYVESTGFSSQYVPGYGCLNGASNPNGKCKSTGTTIGVATDLSKLTVNSEDTETYAVLNGTLSVSGGSETISGVGSGIGADTINFQLKLNK
ncbi:MAG TPA: hypothetical protein VEF34_06590 [Syntrophobacteraceae bacterium]|nr:hypothetical protein [Syntrophobacteraceae bacterium]